MTGHPIGLIIVIGILLLGLLSRTPAAFLLLASFLPGGICGLLLWLHHRRPNEKQPAKLNVVEVMNSEFEWFH